MFHSPITHPFPILLCLQVITRSIYSYVPYYTASAPSPQSKQNINKKIKITHKSSIFKGWPFFRPTLVRAQYLDYYLALVHWFIGYESTWSHPAHPARPRSPPGPRPLRGLMYRADNESSCIFARTWWKYDGLGVRVELCVCCWRLLFSDFWGVEKVFELIWGNFCWWTVYRVL